MTLPNVDPTIACYLGVNFKSIYQFYAIFTAFGKTPYQGFQDSTEGIEIAVFDTITINSDYSVIFPEK